MRDIERVVRRIGRSTIELKVIVAHDINDPTAAKKIYYRIESPVQARIEMRTP